MATLKVVIEQGSNGWILEYVGHDKLERKVVANQWERVIQELEGYFGWWNNGKFMKQPPDLLH